MADIALAASPVATPLAAWLASGEIQPTMAAYHGVITPYELDALEAETAALLRGAAVRDLGWLRRVKVRGEDRFRWLSGMVTNTVSDLPENGGAWNLVLNAQGRIQGDLTVWRKGDKLELEIAVDQMDRLLSHLEHFIIMDDVELAPRQDETALGLSGPKAGEVLARLGLPAPKEPMTHARAEWNGLSVRIRRGYSVLSEHYILWTPSATVHKLWRFLITGGATTVGCAATEAIRVAEGIPRYGVDIQEKDLPQETSQMRALHFSKGCYLGQEIVERIRSRGNVHRHLRALELDGPLPAAGTELSLNGSAAGQITSAAEIPVAGGVRRFAIGMIRGEAELKNEWMNYQVENAAGKATLLAAPPTL